MEAVILTIILLLTCSWVFFYIKKIVKSPKKHEDTLKSECGSCSSECSCCDSSELKA